MVHTAQWSAWGLVTGLVSVGAVLVASTVPARGAVEPTTGLLQFATEPTSTVAGEVIPAITVTTSPSNPEDSTTVPESTTAPEATVMRSLVVGTVTVDVTPGTGASEATLSGRTTQPVVGGTATFDDLVITVAATGYTLTATFESADESVSLDATSAPFDIIAASPSLLTFSTEPTDTSAGRPITPGVAVEARDRFGNLAPEPEVPVTVSLRPEVRLVGTVTARTRSGIATFEDLWIDTPGDGYVLDAAAPRLSGASSAEFRVLPRGQPALVFAAQPRDTVAGEPVADVVVEMRDASGTTIADRPARVRVALETPTGAELTGGTVATTVDGFATFAQVRIERAGPGYRLAASADDAVPVTSDAFDVLPGPAAALTFTRQPGRGNEQGELSQQPEITIQDSFGNRVDTGAIVSVGVTTGAGGSAGDLACAGGESRPAEHGIVTFTGCRVDRAGHGYRLVASALRLPSASSDPFDVGRSGSGGPWRAWAAVFGAAVLVVAAAVGARRWHRARRRLPARVRVVGRRDLGTVQLSGSEATSHTIRIEPGADPGAQDLREMT